MAGLGQHGFPQSRNGNALSWSNCSGSLYRPAQNRGSFTGPFGTQGGGWNSIDSARRRERLTGELVAPDRGIARARLEGNFQNWPRASVSPSCDVVSAGDGVWTGTATSDDIRLQINDVLRLSGECRRRPARNADGRLRADGVLDLQRW
jgi:hypothetical protein